MPEKYTPSTDDHTQWMVNPSEAKQEEQDINALLLQLSINLEG